MSIRFPAPAVALCLTLAACSATPPQPPLRQPMPASYAAGADWVPADVSASAPSDGSWWQVFGDPRLDALERELAQHNQSLAAQLAIFEQAQAALAQARAAYAPTLSADAAASRSGSAAGPSGSGQVTHQEQIGLAASWEPDLWGRVRLQVQAGEATAQASAQTLRATRLSLQAALAQSYLQWCIVDARTALARDTVQAYARALELVRSRYQAGVDTAATVALAQTQLLQAQTVLTDLGLTRAQLGNAMAVLTGAPAPQFALTSPAALPPMPWIPPGVPGSLLQRRPDLAAAALQVEAANASIGVAQRAWLPNLTLGAQGGTQAGAMAQLFTAPSLFWSLGPTLAATLFDGGLRQAQLDVSRAQYRQTVANYRQAVLTAMQQVQDNLAAQGILEREAAQQDQVIEAAERALRLAGDQYRAGTAPYLNVLQAQNTATAARDAALLLRQRRYAAAIGLIQSLGGTWEAPRPVNP